MKKPFSVVLFVLLFNFSLSSYAQTNTFPSSGNVGIGTTSPSAKLEVNGTIKAKDHITINKGGSYRIALNGSSDGYIYGRNDNAENKFLISSNGNTWFNGGNVGIGTSNPENILHLSKNINGSDFIARIENTSPTGEINGLLIIKPNSGTDGANNDKLLDIQSSSETLFRVLGSGNVGIGTSTPTEKLTVNGKIHAKEVKVYIIGWPDYVFKENHSIPSLDEVEKYIKENGHLIKIPSAKEVETNGIQLGEMNMKLLEKIEELTLYIIQLKKENQNQFSQFNEEIKELKKNHK